MELVESTTTGEWIGVNPETCFLCDLTCELSDTYVAHLEKIIKMNAWDLLKVFPLMRPTA